MSSPTPFESAQLILKLYDLRREPVLRRARAWFVRDFNPKTFDELVKGFPEAAERTARLRDQFRAMSRRRGAHRKRKGRIPTI